MARPGRQPPPSWTTRSPTSPRGGFRPAAVFVDGAFTSDGIFAPPPAYLRELVRRTRAAGALFVADEVQAGYGRMGDGLWSFEAAGIVPDIVTLGKPMGNGHPVAAVITRAEIVDRFAAETEFFSTFGGNPVACAAAMAVLDVIEDEGLTANAAAVGEEIRAGDPGRWRRATRRSATSGGAG